MLHLILRLRGGKPVIYLFPPAPKDVQVHLNLVPQWGSAPSTLQPKPSPPPPVRVSGGR